MILGITGTIGAGKGTVVDFLIQDKNFAHYSVRDFLVEEIKKRGLSVNRDTMREVAGDIRAKHAPSYIIETLYNRAQEAGGQALIESVRAIGEAEFLKQRGVPIVAVDADQRIRFERVTLRGSATDDVDFAMFVEHEQKEQNFTNPAEMNVSTVMEMADYRIENNGSLEELQTKIAEMLSAFTMQ